MTTKTDTKYLIVIDTENYSGNFEREICAWITGQIGDCYVGDDFAEITDKEMPEDIKDFFEENVLQEPDEKGCYRPVSIRPTPGWFNHGMGGHFRNGQEEEAKKDHEKKCLEYSQQKVHPNDQKDHEQRWAEKSKISLVKHPAYLSVEIYLNKLPNKTVWNWIKERAESFPEKIKEINYLKNNEIVITDVYVVEEGTKTEETKLIDF